MIRKDIRTGRCVLVLDNSNEGHFNPFSEYFRELFSALLDSLDIPPQSLALFDQNRRARPEDVASSCFSDLSAHLTVIPYDYFLKTVITSLHQRGQEDALQCGPLSSFETFAAAQQQAFLCMIGTPRPHRILFYSWLEQHALAEHGIVSYSGFASQKAKPVRSQVVTALTQPPLSDLLPPATTPEQIEILLDSLPARRADLAPQDDLNTAAITIPVDLYTRTAFSVVCETDFLQDHMCRVTEKTLKSFAMGHPSVVLGNKGSLEIMQKLGFGLHENVFSPEYDSDPDPRSRFTRVTHLVGRATAKWLHNPRSFARSTYELARYNYVHARTKLKSRYDDMVELPAIDTLRHLLFS